MKQVVRSKKVRLLAGAVLVLMVAWAAFWNIEPATGPLRLTFLYTTNHPQLGRVAVFQFVNKMHEPVSASAGVYDHGYPRRN